MTIYYSRLISEMIPPKSLAAESIVKYYCKKCIGWIGVICCFISMPIAPTIASFSPFLLMAVLLAFSPGLEIKFIGLIIVVLMGMFILLLGTFRTIKRIRSSYTQGNLNIDDIIFLIGFCLAPFGCYGLVTYWAPILQAG